MHLTSFTKWLVVNYNCECCKNWKKPEPNKSRAWLCAQCNKNTRVYAGRLRHMKNANITPERKICKSIYTPTRVYNIKHWSQKFKMSSLFTNFYPFFNCPLPPFPPT